MLVLDYLKAFIELIAFANKIKLKLQKSREMQLQSLDSKLANPNHTKEK